MVMHGVEYVRWETVNGYLRRFGFSQHFGKQAGEIRACMVLNTSDGEPSITICGNLVFRRMLRNRRASMPACCVCGRLCGGQDTAVIDTIPKLNKKISITIVYIRC